MSFEKVLQVMYSQNEHLLAEYSVLLDEILKKEEIETLARRYLPESDIKYLMESTIEDFQNQQKNWNEYRENFGKKEN